MAEVTPAKRVLPARERRDSAAKRYSPAPPTNTKRKSTGGSKLAAAPTTSATEDRSKRKHTKREKRSPTPRHASTPPVEETLPTKVTSSKPLPVTRQKQATKLSDKDYQSIAESAILAASLHRSRMQWLSDGIFKKYWVKPVKRKGVIEQPPNNPDAKSMSKLGNGTIIVEPHKLDVTFYTVKEPAPEPQYKPSQQHTPKPPGAAYPMAPPYTPNKPPVPPTSSAPPPQPQPGHATMPAVKQESVAATPRPTASPIGHHPPPQQPLPAPPPPPPPPAAAPKSNTDPVIQMLAARAATDPQLKELMKVVATSKANAEQLKEFQKHIDEFNAVVKKQEAERLERERQQPPPKPGTAPVTTPGPGSQPKPGPSASPLPAVPAASAGSHPSVFSTSAPRPPIQYPAYPPPRVEAIIKHIVVEFHGEGASTDRFLFPDYAALDLRYGGLEMLTSFLVVRKGSEIIANMGENTTDEGGSLGAQAKWKTDTEYYQPVTMMVRANQHRTIETIARAARTLPEVQEHMKNILETKTRAPLEYLVHQLPREKGVTGSEVPSVDQVDSGVEMGSESEDDELKTWYGNA